MKDKVFFDSNILIYAYSLDDTNKRTCIEKLLNKHDIIAVSTQTINEFINVMSKKKKLTYNEILLVVNEIFENFIIESVDISTIQKAIILANTYKYSYFDSLMIASALNGNCSILYSEDMHNNHTIEKNLKIINPF